MAQSEDPDFITVSDLIPTRTIPENEGEWIKVLGYRRGLTAIFTLRAVIEMGTTDDTEIGILDVLCNFFEGAIEYPEAWDALVALSAPQKLLTRFKEIWEHEYEDYVPSEQNRVGPGMGQN